MTRFGEALGAHAATFSGLTGLGDLVLTATGDLSRNRQVGLAIGQGQTLDSLLASGLTAEGARCARARLPVSRPSAHTQHTRAPCATPKSRARPCWPARRPGSRRPGAPGARARCSCPCTAPPARWSRDPYVVAAAWRARVLRARGERVAAQHATPSRVPRPFRTPGARPAPHQATRLESELHEATTTWLCIAAVPLRCRSRPHCARETRIESPDSKSVVCVVCCARLVP